jgi:hypothetical protein
VPEPLLFGLLLTALAGVAIATMLRPGFEDEIGSLIQRAADLLGARIGPRREAAPVAAGGPIRGEPSPVLAMRSEPSTGPATGGSDPDGRVAADAQPAPPDTDAAAPDQPVAEPDGEPDADESVMAATSGEATSGEATQATGPALQPARPAPSAASPTPGSGMLHGLGDLLRAAGARLSGGHDADGSAPFERSGPEAHDGVDRTGEEPAVGEGARSVARRIFRGERDAFDAVVRALEQAEPSMADRWGPSLDRLVAIIRSEALEAGYLDPPRNQAFWVAFSVEQGRDVMKALASLGFRVEADGGWLDDRAPTRRDLSIAIGYAGVDPVRVRSWPAPEELEALGRQVTIAAAEYLELVAPGLTLAEVSGAAESTEPRPELAELWREWDRVRPLLLAEG